MKKERWETGQGTSVLSWPEFLFSRIFSLGLEPESRFLWANPNDKGDNGKARRGKGTQRSFAMPETWAEVQDPHLQTYLPNSSCPSFILKERGQFSLVISVLSGMHSFLGFGFIYD